MDPLKIYTSEILDSESEIHFAIHTSLKDITLKHYHDFYEIFLIAKGKVVHIINERKQILTEGSLVFIRPSDIHYFERHESYKPEIVNLAFPKTVIDELMKYLGEGFYSERLILGETPPSVILSNDQKTLMREKLERLHLLPLDKKNEIKTNLRILLVEIFTKYFSPEFWRLKRTVPDWLEIVKNETQKKENFTKGFQAMTNIAGRSKEHLCREFKKNFKATPTEYINNLRLNYGANLLMNTDESIPYISFESGFENLSHFYHLFKKKFNMSPAQFRKQNKKSVIP